MLAFPEQPLLSHHRQLRPARASAGAQAPRCLGSLPALQPPTPGLLSWDLLRGIKVGWPKHVTPQKHDLLLQQCWLHCSHLSSQTLEVYFLTRSGEPNCWFTRWQNTATQLGHHSLLSWHHRREVCKACRKADRTQSWLSNPFDQILTNRMPTAFEKACPTTSTAAELLVPQHYNHGFWVSSSLHYSWHLTHSHLTAPDA